MTKALSLALLLCLLVSSAGAVCMVPQPRLVCAEYFKEQAVVIARLVRARYVDPKKDEEIDYHLYTMRTERVLRGEINPSFRIYEENSSGRAGFEWEEGETYLLFLSYIKRDKGWELDGCGNSGPLSKSAKVLKEIDKINAAPIGDGGVIAGQVWFDPGITVIARGTAGKFTTKSDQKGAFSIHVPAGVYSVRASERGSRFVADDMSYELPRRVNIVNGGCAQVCFSRVDADEAKHPSERPPGN